MQKETKKQPNSLYLYDFATLECDQNIKKIT
jgi:hypothetical protein